MQGNFCPTALGDILEQDRDLASFGRLDAKGGDGKDVSGGNQLLFELQRLARAQYLTVAGDPAVRFVGDHLAQLLPDHVGDAGVFGISCVGHDMHIVTQRAVRAIEKFDDAETFVHGIEQRPVEVLIVCLVVGQPRLQQSIALLQFFYLLAQGKQVAGRHADVRRNGMARL
ncbi:hypothetical protein D3C81_1155000 [compost metagenome]